MKKCKTKERVGKDELIRRVQEAANKPLTSEEKREQRISYVLSVVGRFDDETRKEVEQIVDEVYR